MFGGATIDAGNPRRSRQGALQLDTVIRAGSRAENTEWSAPMWYGFSNLVRWTPMALLLLAGCSQVHRYPPPQSIGPVVKDALSRAQLNHRPVLINTRSPYCEPCEAFMADAETEPDLGRALDVFEWVTLDSTMDEADCSALSIDAYPTFIVLTPGGLELGRWIGYASPPAETIDRLGTLLLQAARDFESSNRPQVAYWLYRWTGKVVGPSAVGRSARESMQRLVNDGHARPDTEASWPGMSS